METKTKRGIDYLAEDISAKTAKPGIYTNPKKDINPFRSVYIQRRYSFVVDWQVCDEEHLGSGNLPEGTMF